MIPRFEDTENRGTAGRNVDERIDISVIVPVFGVEQYVERFMESVCCQTIDNFRIIVIDDQTQDRSIEIIGSYKDALGDRLIIIKNRENIGLSKSRNVGIDYVFDAPTKYITFLDPDDWIEEGYLEDLYTLAERNQLDLCISGLLREEESTNRLICKELVSMPQEVFEYPEECLQLAYINPCAYSKLYKYEPIKDLRFRNIKRSEDTCYLFEALSRFRRIQFTNNAKYHYCLRENSLTGNVNEEKYESMHEGFVEVLREITNERLSELFVVQIFTRSSLGGVFRLSFKDMRKARSIENREFDYLERNVPLWRENRFLCFSRDGIGSKSEFVLRVCAMMYRMHLFVIVIWGYYFVNRVIGKDYRP